MKKWKDVSIRVKVLIPIVLMLVLMGVYLIVSVAGFREMHLEGVTMSNQRLGATVLLDDINLESESIQKRAYAYCVNADAQQRQEIWEALQGDCGEITDEIAASKEVLTAADEQEWLSTLNKRMSDVFNALNQIKSRADAGNEIEAVEMVSTTLAERVDLCAEVIDMLIADNSEHAQAMVTRQAVTYRVMLMGAVGCAVIFLAIFIFTVWNLDRKVTGRLRKHISTLDSIIASIE